MINHPAGTIESEAVPLDVEEPVEAKISLWGLNFDSIKRGIVGLICSSKSLLLSRATTSDMVGLIAADGWVHNKAMSKTFFTSSAS